MECKEASELLPLSIDRELDARSEGALAAHVASCATCDRERRRLVGLIGNIRSASTYHRAPEALRQRIEAALPSPANPMATALPAGERRTGSGWRFGWRLLNGAGLIAAACAALVLVLIWPQPPSADQRLADEVIASHARALLSDHLIDVASSDQHTVKPWFSARLDFSPPVPDLSGEGFPLAGGRLDYLDRHPVAVLVYRRRQHLIEVFVWPTDGAPESTSPRSSQGYHVVGWSAAGMNFRAISDVDPAELQRLSALIR